MGAFLTFDYRAPSFAPVKGAHWTPAPPVLDPLTGAVGAAYQRCAGSAEKCPCLTTEKDHGGCNTEPLPSLPRPVLY
ncbi:MAG: hypothetical protein QOI12_5212 [Alphaproteobacteria bacterium]|nr:hypothetical protein [Alphaproteobacteria bacterium]